MNGKQHKALTDFFEHHHNNPPAPFNPHYDPAAVARRKVYDAAIQALPANDHMTDNEYDAWFDAEVLKLRRIHDVKLPLSYRN